MTEQRADEALTNATTFLNNSCKYILNDGFLDIDKYGSYIDKIRPFFVSTLEQRIYWILEEFVYKEDSPLAKHFPYLKRWLDAAVRWTEPLEALCSKYEDANLAEETIRLTIKHLIKDGLIDGFVSSIVLNNRLNRICRELDALGVEQNLLKNFDLPDFIREQRSSTDYYSNSSGTRTLGSVNGSNDSDLEVEIGSSSSSEVPSSRKRARKRAATYDSPSNADIDPREPAAESQLPRGPSQDSSFRISEDPAHRLESEGDLVAGSSGIKNGRASKAHRSLCTLAYRVQNSTSDWKNARLKLIVRKGQVAKCHCGSMKSITSRRLLLPCKVLYIKDRIFEADPTLTEVCLRVTRRKFENGLRNVCSCLNDVLRRMTPREITRLCVLCEIRPSYIGFRLKPRDKWKCSACLLVVRVPICRNVCKRAGIREAFLRDSMRAHDASNSASLVKSAECSGNEGIGCTEGRASLHSSCSNDGAMISDKISKTNAEDNSTVSEDGLFLLDRSVNLSPDYPRESFADSNDPDLEDYDTEKMISQTDPADGTDGVFSEKVPDCICTFDENGDSNTKGFCGLTNCIKRKNTSWERLPGINIEEEGNQCRGNSASIADDLRAEIFERPKEQNELYSTGTSEEQPREIISGLQSKLITSLNSNEKLETRKAKFLCCNKSISCSILFDEEEGLTSLEKCLKIMKSSSWEEKYQPLIASGVKGILDLLFLEAKGRFETLQQPNVKSYSVSVQTLEADPSRKGESAESFSNVVNVAASDTEKRSRNLEDKEYKEEDVDQDVSKMREINVDKSEGCVPRSFCEAGASNEDRIFTRSKNVSMKSEEKEDLTGNVSDFFTKRCEPKVQRTFVSPEPKARKNQSRVGFDRTPIRNTSTINSEKNNVFQRHEVQTIPSDSRKSKFSRTANPSNRVDLKTLVLPSSSRSNYCVKVYREQKRYRVSSLNAIRRGNSSSDRKWRVSDEFHRSFSGKSINRIKQLLRAKLSKILPERSEATSTSKTCLRNDKYLVSVLKAKASRSCQCPLTSLVESCEPASKSREDSSLFVASRAQRSRTVCSDVGQARRLLGGSERYENSIEKSSPYVAPIDFASIDRSTDNQTSRDSKRGKLSVRGEYGVTKNLCAKCRKKSRTLDLGDTCPPSVNDGKYEEIRNNQRRLSTRNLNNGENVNSQNQRSVKMDKKFDRVRTCCDQEDKETSPPTLTRFRCCDKENYEQSSASSETIHSHRRTLSTGKKSQSIRTGRNSCSNRAENSAFCEKQVTGDLEELCYYKYVNNLSLDFRIKLARYVKLCKSVRCSLLSRLRPDDIYEVSTTSIPSAYADKK